VKVYTPAEIEAALAIVDATRKPDGTPNWSRAARESGVTRPTLKGWQAAREEGDLPVAEHLIDTHKRAIADSFLEKVRRVREAAADRLLELMPTESDMHKVAGAMKLANEAGRLEAGEPTEVSRVESIQRELPERAAIAAAEALKRKGLVN
jgi:hypothetical protein